MRQNADICTVGSAVEKEEFLFCWKGLISALLKQTERRGGGAGDKTFIVSVGIMLGIRYYIRLVSLNPKMAISIL